MRVTTALACCCALAAAHAQGTVYYVPDPDASAGPCNTIPFGTARSSVTFANQRYQLVVRAAELGNLPGGITGLGFAPCASGTHRSTSLRVTLAHVPPGFSFATNTHFDDNLFVHGTNAQVVLSQDDYAWPQVGSSWSGLGLDSSYLFQPSSDLLVDIEVTGNDVSGTPGLRVGSGERLYALGWIGFPPPNGTAETGAALKLQVVMGCASTSGFGYGCGPGRLSYSGAPLLGRTFRVELDGAGANLPAVINFGTGNSAPYPIDLGAVGAPGCALLCDSRFGAFGTVTDGTGHASVPLTVPLTRSVIGMRAFNQWIHVDPSVPQPFSFTAGGRFVVGVICP